MGCCKDCDEIKEFEKKFEEGVPYIETQISEDTFIRTFPNDTPYHWLKWHWDEEYRSVEALNENDWQFQFDDELPFVMKIGKSFGIPAGKYHRVIKGTTDLQIKIKKMKPTRREVI